MDDRRDTYLFPIINVFLYLDLIYSSIMNEDRKVSRANLNHYVTTVVTK